VVEPQEACLRQDHCLPLPDTLVEGLTSKQEGEWRAHGFDYKLQQEAGTVDWENLEKERQDILAFNEFVDDLQRKTGLVFH
jgi:hypothetical protein